MRLGAGATAVTAMTERDEPSPLTLEWLQEEGGVVAVLDGERYSGKDVRDIHGQVVSAAARRAAASPHGVLIVAVRSGGAEQGRWRITTDGAVTRMTDADSDATDDGTTDDASHAGRGRGPQSRRPAVVRGRRVGRPTARRSRPTARLGRMDRTGRIGRLGQRVRLLGGRITGRSRSGPLGRSGSGPLGRPLLVLTIACVALALALGAWTLLRVPGATGPTTVRGERMAATAPLEWSADSVWRTPALLADAGRVLVTGDAVAFVTNDRRVALVDAASGQTRWSAPYPAGDPRTDLTVSTIDDHEAIAAQVGERLAWWDLATGAPGGMDLPGGSAVVLRGTAPLVVAADGTSAALVREGRLLTGDLPDRSTALAGRADGVITAAGSAGWWHLKPGQPPPAPRAWEVPGGSGAPAVIAYLGGSLVTLLRVGENSAPQILVFSDRENDVRFAWIGPGIFEEPSATWHPSPSRNWGILGRTLVDLDAGRATDLGRWTTQLVSADRALGDLAGERVLAGPAIPLGSLQQGESFPEDLTDAGALVRTRIGSDEVVYLLPPKERP